MKVQNRTGFYSNNARVRCSKICSSELYNKCNPDGKHYVGQPEQRQPLLSLAESRIQRLTLAKVLQVSVATNDTMAEGQLLGLELDS